MIGWGCENSYCTNTMLYVPKYIYIQKEYKEPYDLYMKQEGNIDLDLELSTTFPQCHWLIKVM